jgi:SAM-dependent methyltransferase
MLETREERIPKNVSMSNDWYELTDPTHFWIQWRFRLLQNALKSIITSDTKILEIGCGNGLVMYQFEKLLNVQIEGCDLNSFALNNLLDISGKTFHYDIYDLQSDLLEKYDVIILLDVIEHIDDDCDFLKTAMRYLKKGGIIIIGVPALQSLYSKYDLIGGHKRRYIKRGLIEKIKVIGADPIQCNYWGFTLLPLVFIRKIYLYFSNNEDVIKKGFKPPYKLLNWVFIQLMHFETFFFPKTVIGTSILALGRKR